MIETEGQIGGKRLEPGQAFNFACHAGLACFNSCCAGKRLPLFPYDLLRLRRALGLSSPELLGRHAEMEEDPASGWPALRIKLDGDGRCPFLGPEGCGVYEHRPAACRTYPLARAAAPAGDGPPQVVFLRLQAPACLGWGEPRALSLEQWVDEQGLKPYQQANDRLLGLLFHPRRRGRMYLSPQQTHAVVLALYNLDVFRQLAAQPGFGQRQGLGPARVRAALGDDEALLALGEDWLADKLFGPAPASGKGRAKKRGR